MKSSVEVLKQALAFLSDSSNWTRGTYHDSYGRYCAVGAVERFSDRQWRQSGGETSDYTTTNTPVGLLAHAATEKWKGKLLMQVNGRIYPQVVNDKLGYAATIEMFELAIKMGEALEQGQARQELQGMLCPDAQEVLRAA